MLFILEHHVFLQDQRQDLLALMDLLITAARLPMVHAVLCDPPFDEEDPDHPAEVWLRRHNEPLQSAFRSVLREGPVLAASRRSGAQLRRGDYWQLAPPLRVQVRAVGPSRWDQMELWAPDAALLARQPLRMIVENQWNDLAFVRLLCGPTEQRDLDKLLDCGAIVPLGGGLGAVRTYVKEMDLDGHNDATLQNRCWRLRAKSWVMFDRDASDQDAEQPSKDSATLLELCERLSTPAVPLSYVRHGRRTLENYIPDDHLRSTPNAPHPLQSVRKTQPGIAWAMNVSKGLSADLKPDIDSSIRDSIKADPKCLKACWLKRPFDALPEASVRALAEPPTRLKFEASWALKYILAGNLRAEYARGPDDQAPADQLVQSIFDRV